MYTITKTRNGVTGYGERFNRVTDKFEEEKEDK